MLAHWSDDDQAYLVTLPECADRVLGPVPHGETYDEAIRNGHAAEEALIASARQHQEPPPEPHVFVGV
jgi:predicted RNase H-like HicB family nuclease